MDPILIEPNKKIESAVNHFQTEIAGIRAGRANPALVENIPVEAYGGRMKLMEVGTIAAPQPTLLTVQVWDASILPSVIKAIQESNLGINPAADGTLIRLPIPALTQERRVEFIKLIHQKMEEVKVEIRQIRGDVRSGWHRNLEEEKISEDELFRREKLLQDLIDKKIVEIEQLGQKKETELLQI